MAQRRVWDSDRDHIQVSAGHLFYTYTRGEANPDNIESMVRNFAEFVGQSSEPVGYILHVVGTATPPSAEDGARVTTMFNSHASQLVGVALVIEAGGFTGAILRSAITMVFILKREGFKTKTFERVADAAAWLGALLRMQPMEIANLAEFARGVLSAEQGLE